MKKQVVAITGGSSGIGKALAVEYVKKGAHVIIGARREDVLGNTAAELEELSPEEDRRVYFHRLDVTDNESVLEFIQFIIGTFGKIDVLVNSAGFALCKEIENTAVEEIESQNDSNYLGTARMIRAAVPHMMEQRAGHIVNIASMAGILGVYGYTGYSPSKFAVVGLSDVLRSELSRFGIRVSLVLPPDTDTPSYHHENLTKPLITHKISGTVKLMQPEVLARLVMRQIEKGSYRIIPGTTSKLVYHLNRIFPNLFFRYSKRIIRKAQDRQSR